jgi:hypothetical protein
MKRTRMTFPGKRSPARPLGAPRRRSTFQQKGGRPAGCRGPSYRSSKIGRRRTRRSREHRTPDAADVAAVVARVQARCDRSVRCSDHDWNVTSGALLIALISGVHGDEAWPELRLFLDACAPSSCSEAPASHLQPYPRIRLEIEKPSWMPGRAGKRGHHHETTAVLQIQDGYRPLES